MKIIKKIITISMLLFSIASNAQLPFFEGFESGAKPSGWSEVYVSGTEPWRYRNGGHSPNDNNWLIPPEQTDITRNPPSAHTGTYNAIFFKQSTDNERTKLVTKLIDLSEAIQPELSFWLCQVPWTFSGNTNWDIFRVYYKTSFSGNWILLAEYLDPLPTWTQFKINLPNPNSTYYIGFEGQTQWGYGTCIDDISIIEKADQERYVSELIVNQADYTFAPSGSNNEPILSLRFKVFGNKGSAILKNIVAKSLNSNDEDISTDGVKLYKTTTNQFNTSNPIGTGGNFSNGSITFSNLNLELPNGFSYLWLTYDVKQSATHGNLLDAMFESGNIQVNDSLYPKVSESPVGSRIIYETIYRQDFEGSHGWALDGEFQVDAPQGKGGLSFGYPDPTYAYSGNKVLGTDLSGLGIVAGDYENNISEEGAYKAISPTINALFYKDLKVSYRRYLNIDVWDKTTIDVSKNDGATWNNVWVNNAYFTDQLWTKTFHDVPSSISRSNQLKFMFKMGPTTPTNTYSGWNIDDFIVTGDYITKDVGVVEWVYPKTGCGNSATDSVVVKVANLGAAASPSSIPIQYSFDNGVSWVTNFVTQSINPGDTISFIFPTKVNLSVPGIRNVKARTKLTGDEDASNDVISAQIYLVPTYTLPITQQFEASDGFWRPMGTSIWQWGLITKPSMSGGSTSWATSLTQNYGELLTGSTDTLFFDNFEEYSDWSYTGEFEIASPTKSVPSYTFSGIVCLGTDLTLMGENPGMYENNILDTITSPDINISNYTDLQLSFYRWFKVLDGDTVRIQVSNNNTNWVTIWSNNGLAETSDNDWNKQTLNLPNSIIKGNTLKIRFLLITNGSDVAEGINVDDIMVTGKQYNSNFAYLQSPCFDLTGVTIPIIDLSVFNNTEAGVDGASLYYSTDNGNTWSNVNNNDLNSEYWNWYTDSIVSSIGSDGWNGIDNQWRRSRHQLPSALANHNRVIFKVGFKSDKANNDFGGFAIDNFKLYEAPFDVGVESIASPISACDLSNQQEIKLNIKNFGPQNMKSGDSIVVAINVQHPMMTDSKTDKIFLSSDLNVGSSIEHNISKKFNMSISGDYNITAYTDIESDPLFYNPTSNNSINQIITVQKPYAELGEDIKTYFPDTVVLDATNADPLVTYEWFKAPDKVTVIGTDPTFSITDHNGGKYYVKLTNTIPCSSTDSITVSRLTRDTGIPSFNSPVSSCELSNSTPFKVYLKNYGSDVLTNGDEVYLHYIFNGGTQVDTTWVMDKTILPNDSLVFTFNESLNMQAIGSYTLKAWATVTSDESASNDTTDLTINVWGYPTFSLKDAMGLPKDSVNVFNTNYTLDPGVWDSYLWKNNNSTNRTYNMDITGWATVTVFDAHTCSAIDSLYVNLKFSDVGIESVVSPISACEIEGTVYPHIIIKNMGTDTLTSGTDINLEYYFNSTLKESPTLTLDSNLPPNGTKDIIFGVGVDISTIGNYSFDFSASTLADSKPENNSKNHLVSVFGYPALELGDSIITRNANYTIDALAGRDSYLWSTSETTQQITVNQTNKYKVTVVENGICSSTDSLVVTFLHHDYTISQVINPVTSCSTTSDQDIIFKYSNIGSDTLKIGQQVKFGYQIDEDYFAEENYSLTSDLVPGQFINYTFTNKIDLSNAGIKHFIAYGIYSGDINTNNDTLEFDFEIKATPIVNLGVDRIIRTGQETLDGGEGTDYSYLWQDNSTSRFFIVENTGDYWVTTTSPNGCYDRDTVNIKSLYPDYKVSTIISPVSACSHTNAEQVEIEIENVGTDTLFVGQTIYVTYEVNNAIEKTEPITMVQKFNPGNKLTHTFSKTYNLQNVNTYNIKAYTTYSLDLNPLNNALTSSIQTWNQPIVALGNDTAICQGSAITLDAGNPSNTYLWSTTETTQTIEVSTAGNYSVEVTNSNGCKNSDAITISINSLPSVSHSTLSPICIDATPIVLSGGNPTGGLYSGAGVTGATFTPATAGLGLHSITYQVTDGNGCTNSTTVDITVNSLPVIDLGDDKSVSEPTILDAGAGYNSYLWNTSATTQTITVNSSGTYSVTVTDANGCNGFDEVTITWQDIVDVQATALISPSTTSNCYNAQGQTVTATLKNLGTNTFTSGQGFDVSYQIDTNTPVVEALTLNSDFASTQTRNFTFNQKAILDPGTYTFYFKTIIGSETVTDYPVTITANPVFTFSNDTIKTTLPYQLTSNISGVTYLWNTGNPNPSIQVSSYGKYWLTVTSAGCSTTDTIVIAPPGDAVETIPGSNAKVTYFPNPVSKELTIKIETDKNESFTIDLVSPSGQIIKNIKTDKTQFYNDKINVNGLNAGLYLLKVGNGKGSAIFKVIVQH